ncbi:hypothetical protein FRB90_008294 [Tulasnella sp. 427]|nr:hypothetical protein FRB90_008294 [Tulasnella sp. 427]
MCGQPRSPEATLSTLQEALKLTLEGFTAKVDNLFTETGVKDKFLMHFIDRIRSVSDVKPDGTDRAADEVLADRLQLFQQFPEFPYNPALRIPDTPVEILHVLLLGFVKYLWRDAVSRQDVEGKELLKTRLSSLDVRGLGLSRLRGHTLVQYAGSLTGGDFRSIIQVGPLVLHGLVPKGLLTVWQALGRMAALVYQPSIPDIDEYCDRLTSAIQSFLEVTALWNPNWFNKPKFHVILHLPVHIRRFGPAVLYATETFESYNHVIRTRSIHSNRHAPSLDIANAFSHMHAVRHLISGGWFMWSKTDSDPPQMTTAGSAIQASRGDAVLMKLMGMAGLPLITVEKGEHHAH